LQDNNESYSLFPDFDEETVLKGLEVLLHHSNIATHGEGISRNIVHYYGPKIFPSWGKNMKCKISETSAI